jgi:hypothetical protein
VNAAQALLDRIEPGHLVAQIRHDLACEHLDDLRRLDTQMRTSRRRLEPTPHKRHQPPQPPLDNKEEIDLLGASGARSG